MNFYRTCRSFVVEREKLFFVQFGALTSRWPRRGIEVGWGYRPDAGEGEMRYRGGFTLLLPRWPLLRRHDEWLPYAFRAFGRIWVLR